MMAPAGLERDLLILACAISAGVHGALTPTHWNEGTAAGAGFLAATLLLAGLATVLTWQAHRTALLLTGLTLAGLVGSYVLAVTSGLPVLHPQPEPADGLGLATKLVEAAGLALALDLLRRGRSALSAAPLRPKGTTT